MGHEPSVHYSSAGEILHTVRHAPAPPCQPVGVRRNDSDGHGDEGYGGGVNINAAIGGCVVVAILNVEMVTVASDGGSGENRKITHLL